VSQSKEEFKKRTGDWAGKIGVQINTISLRRMKNKWASYTERSGLLIFNAELLDMDEKLIDYVIVHELLHFLVPNHGRLWKSMMTGFIPDWKDREEALAGSRKKTSASAGGRK